jgi:hypothetical protein
MDWAEAILQLLLFLAEIAPWALHDGQAGSAAASQVSGTRPSREGEPPGTPISSTSSRGNPIWDRELVG